MLDMAELAYAGRRRRPGAPRWCSTCAAARSPPTWPARCGRCKERGFRPRVVFVDADDEVLIRRFESVRRSHPLQGDGRLADGIAAERELLEEAREQADVIIDTSHLNVNQLRRRVEEMFGGEDARRLRVTVLSLRLQVRPAARRRLRARRPLPAQPVLGAGAARPRPAATRRSAATCSASTARCTFVETYARLINATAPGFEREGKRYLTVAVGCTGGKHRSVAIAEELARRLRDVRLSAPPSTATWGANDGLGRAGRRVRRRPRPGRLAACAARAAARARPRHHRGGDGRRRRRLERPAARRARPRCRRATCARRWPRWPPTGPARGGPPTLLPAPVRRDRRDRPAGRARGRQPGARAG